MKNIKGYFSLVQVWCAMVTPIVLLMLPSTYFDRGQTLCLSVLLFHRECYACGITRAVMHLLHLEYKDAAYFNILSFVVLPLLGFMWARVTVRYIVAVKKEKTFLVNFLYNTKWQYSTLFKLLKVKRYD